MEELKVPVITGWDNEAGTVCISNYSDNTKTELLDTYMCQLLPTPSSIKDIQWSGECKYCEGIKVAGTRRINGRNIEEDIPCPKCNGTGTITRPATLEEILSVAPDLVDVTSKTMCKHRLSINNGTLRVKGSDNN
jgi:hypothetical protein